MGNNNSNTHKEPIGIGIEPNDFTIVCPSTVKERKDLNMNIYFNDNLWRIKTEREQLDNKNPEFFPTREQINFLEMRKTKRAVAELKRGGKIQRPCFDQKKTIEAELENKKRAVLFTRERRAKYREIFIMQIEENRMAMMHDKNASLPAEKNKKIIEKPKKIIQKIHPLAKVQVKPKTYPQYLVSVVFNQEDFEETEIEKIAAKPKQAKTFFVFFGCDPNSVNDESEVNLSELVYNLQAMKDMTNDENMKEYIILLPKAYSFGDVAPREMKYSEYTENFNYFKFDPKAIVRYLIENKIKPGETFSLKKIKEILEMVGLPLKTEEEKRKYKEMIEKEKAKKERLENNRDEYKDKKKKKILLPQNKRISQYSSSADIEEKKAAINQENKYNTNKPLNLQSELNIKEEDNESKDSQFTPSKSKIPEIKNEDMRENGKVENGQVRHVTIKVIERNSATVDNGDNNKSKNETESKTKVKELYTEEIVKKKEVATITTKITPKEEKNFTIPSSSKIDATSQISEINKQKTSIESNVMDRMEKNKKEENKTIKEENKSNSNNISHEKKLIKLKVKSNAKKNEKKKEQSPSQVPTTDKEMKINKNEISASASINPQIENANSVLAKNSQVDLAKINEQLENSAEEEEEPIIKKEEQPIKEQESPQKAQEPRQDFPKNENISQKVISSNSNSPISQLNKKMLHSFTMPTTIEKVTLQQPVRQTKNDKNEIIPAQKNSNIIEPPQTIAPESKTNLIQTTINPIAEYVPFKQDASIKNKDTFRKKAPTFEEEEKLIQNFANLMAKQDEEKEKKRLEEQKKENEIGNNILSPKSVNSDEDFTTMCNYQSENITEITQKMQRRLVDPRKISFLMRKLERDEDLKNLVLQPSNIDLKDSYPCDTLVSNFFSNERFPKFKQGELSLPKFTPLIDVRLKNSFGIISEDKLQNLKGKNETKAGIDIRKNKTSQKHNSEIIMALSFGEMLDNKGGKKIMDKEIQKEDEDDFQSKISQLRKKSMLFQQILLNRRKEIELANIEAKQEEESNSSLSSIENEKANISPWERATLGTGKNNKKYKVNLGLLEKRKELTQIDLMERRYKIIHPRSKTSCFKRPHKC